jgi:PII-like signaling protein
MISTSDKIVRMTVYIGEDKRHGEVSLCQAIIDKARQLDMAGATVYRGIEGFGRSTRLHTYETLMSEDLPVVIEIIDTEHKAETFHQLLKQVPEIALITFEPIAKVWSPDAEEPRVR